MTESMKRMISYVWHIPSGFCFYVATCERDSSAAVTPPRRFNETIAWEYDWDERETGGLVAMAGEGNAVDQLLDVCRQLAVPREYVDPEERDD